MNGTLALFTRYAKHTNMPTMLPTMLRALVVTKHGCMYCEALAEGVHDLESLLLCKLACKLHVYDACGE